MKALYRCGWLKSHDSRAHLADNLRALRGLSKNPVGKQAHHDLPVTKEFELKFLQAGLDPNDGQLGRFVDKAKHKTWSENPGFISGGPFNQAWRQFFKKHESPTTAQILQFMNELRSGVPQTLTKRDGTTAVWIFQ